ncbi:universal stress protein [Aureimonas sp. SK2]|uniref:universal stress protein n=1 Tax=Aureimonas sp. SK2 TaxID=3015992 RepID=UPI0024446300|nr:universal stress protein [Aureimonas sp. SK2]
MTKIIACIDGSAYGASVCDHAAWAAQRLVAPVEVVHALGRRDTSSAPFDLSGSLEFGGREALIGELAELDRQKAKLATTRGHHILAEAVARLRSDGVGEVTEKLRHGDVADTITDLDAETRLVVIGKRGEAADFAKGHLGSNLERVVRSATRPVLIAARAFRPVERALICFDGSPSSERLISKLTRSPLLSGTQCKLLLVGEASEHAQCRLRAAEQILKTCGFPVTVLIEDGEPDEVIASRVKADGIDLLVMGAYGHSRIRHLIVGSTTTALIQSCAIPVLVIR